MLEAEIEICYAVSTWRDLAGVDGETIGLLYRRIKQNFTWVSVCQLLMSRPIKSFTYRLLLHKAKGAER